MLHQMSFVVVVALLLVLNCVIPSATTAPQNPVGLWTPQESGGKGMGHNRKVGVEVGVKVRNFLF